MASLGQGRARGNSCSAALSVLEVFVWNLGTGLQHICDLGTGLHRKRKQSKIRRKTDKEERRRQGGREGARYSEAACSPRVQLQEMMRN